MGKKILIVNVNWVGDVLFSTPFIRTVREHNPDAYIACLLHPRCQEMLEGSPRIDEIIIYDEEGVHKSLFGKLKLIAYLRGRRFDTAFLLHRSFTKALIVLLGGIRERIGYATKNRSGLLTRIVDEPEEGCHKVEYFLNIARSVGMEVGDIAYEFFITDADKDFIKDLLKQNGVADSDKLIVVCPGGNWDPKRWPRENFAGLADKLIEKFGVKVAIAGAAKDVRLAEDIQAIMKHEAVKLCGKTSLKQLGALLKRADLVIANDTGPMHVAVSMNAKVIALFGPTSPDLTGPYGKGRYRVIFKNDGCEVPCYDMACDRNRCMAMIAVDEALAEAGRMLSEEAGIGRRDGDR